MKRLILISIVTLAIHPFQVCAQTGSSNAIETQLAKLQASVENLTKLVNAQQKRIVLLETSNSQTSPTKVPAEIGTIATNTALPSAEPTPQNLKPSGSYVPDIGVVSDIVGTSTESKLDEGGNDRLSVREVELVFGHDVDPYSRMDVVATFSDQENPDIEEANVTYWGLPYGIKAKIGRMRQRIGKATSAHRDSLDTVDEPFVIQSNFGPEGLFRTGLELSAFSPLSLDSYTQEFVLGVSEGGVGEGALLGDVRRHPTGYGHLANFFEISDSKSFELGGTYLIGSSGPQSQSDVHLFGVDATYIHFFSAVNKLKLLSEVYFQNRETTSLVDSEDNEHIFDSSPYGFYTLADYRLSERFGIGLRYDYAQPTEIVASQNKSDRGYSAYLTFFQSEFARWRFQYQRADLRDGLKDDRFFLQGTFAIGAHKHQLN